MGKATGFMEYGRKEMKEVPVRERVNSFAEFRLPLKEEARREQAARCMDCGVPFCQSAMKLSGMVTGCPLHNLIPEWNDALYAGQYAHALTRLLKTSSFPEFTGRVCPALCEKACMCGQYGDPVSVHDNELFLIEYGFAHGLMKPRIPKIRSGKTVAVVGSGPAGLACAYKLALDGCDVTIFEAQHEAGGVLRYGIPEYRLPKETVVEHEVRNVTRVGVKIVTDCPIGKEHTIDDLFVHGFEAVFLGVGAWSPKHMGIPGEDAEGVYTSDKFLSIFLSGDVSEPEGLELKQHVAGKDIVVVGGGNVAMDVARTAVRLGARVQVVYRRSEAELPARSDEIAHAKEEGVVFNLLTNPVAVAKDINGAFCCVELV